MFKKLKDKIEEEFKQAPLKFPVSVQQLAQVISPSQSVNSLSDNNASSSSLTYPADMSNVSTDFFSIGGDDDPQDGINKMPLTLHSVDLTANSPSNMTQNMSRSRRSSLSSVTSEASSLFPIYEGGVNQNFFQSDLESEMEDGMSGQIEKVSKEQLYQSFKKILNRYNKYKGRYTDLMKHYKELQHDNFKTKNVLQESQDKALRRMAELREQCQLEQKAKAHLEESLRNDVEERDHIINTLKTKISLLTNGAESGQLIELDADSTGTKSENNSQSKELWHLKSQNEDLQREVERLKKIKETACNFIHRCDTTINEATEDVKSDNLKQKMSELKSEIQKMKSENESLSHLLSRNIITEEDRKGPASGENSLITDLSSLESSQGEKGEEKEKEKKIEKLNNLLLKCKEKISGLNAELKAKDLIIEEDNKKLKELREEVGACKLREEENALSVAENKKAIHEELNAKEEQIKALTKALKTKENEFIKEKAELTKVYEDKIRDLTNDHKKEAKQKSEQIQKLQEDLKAKEIVSGTLDKVRSIEENFANMLEFVRMRSSAFEEFAKSKTTEIETAQQRLEQRLTSARENLMELLQNAKKAKAVEQAEAVTQQKLFETHSKAKNPNAELSENFHTVEKLKSDVINLSKKLEILESELEKAKNEAKSEREEKDKWREKHGLIEAELEKVRKDFQEKLNENAELGKELTDKTEKIKKVENEKKILQRASNEKIETESKLREYIENYNKLEKENRTLQNDLVEKCGKLLKELNDSKEKLKSLESQEKAKANELEAVKSQYSNEEKVKSEENERLKNELEALRSEMDNSREEMEKLRNESEKMKVLTEEGEATKRDVEKLEGKIKEQEAELEKREERTKELESDLANVRKEMSQEKRSSETIRNELDALRNNLKLELKEKDEKSILVDKLTQECNLLMAEIENLKKTHGKAEKKLENDVEELKKELLEKNGLLEKFKGELEQSKKEQENNTTGVTELTKKCETLTAEVAQLKQQQAEEEAIKAELKTASDDLKNKLSENEKLRQELTDQISGLTNEKNEMFGELQVRLNEIETLKNGLKSVREELGERTKAFEEEKVRIMSENENKLNVLKNEIKFINTKHEEDIGNFEENINSEMKEVNEKMEVAEKASAELLEKLERITSERDELRLAQEEKNMKISELESCMMGLKMELDEKFNEDAKEVEEVTEKHSEEVRQIIMRYDKEIAERDDEIELLKMKFSNEEEINKTHREEVKQIILQYDKEIAERDEEVDTLKSKLSGYDDALEHLRIAKEELKILTKELAEKDSVLEEKLEETIRLKQDGSKTKTETETAEEAVKELQQKLEEQKAETERVRSENERVLEEEKAKWKEKMAELSEKHERELKSWNSQKKNENINTEKSGGLAEPECLEEVALESTSKVAVAALESGSGSIELLQKQLIQQAAEMKELKKQHKREIIDLKKTSASRGRRGRRNSSENQDWLSGGGGGLENDTEHEYLRNILYEYMMGKEQLVLAKVLSAIVKFNEEQTHNVLEKEQQRQTLFGQLGLL